MKGIRVFKAEENGFVDYTVIIDGDAYAMDLHPLRYYGINQYCGTKEELNLNRELWKEVRIRDLSAEIKKAIFMRLNNGWEDEEWN